MKAWLRGIGIGCVGVLALLLLGVALLFGRYVRDDWILDRAVRAVALDWRDFGLKSAQLRMQYELDRGGIGLYVRDDDCLLEELLQTKVVRCSWDVVVVVPIAEWRVPLSFSSMASIEADGSLR